MATSLGYIRNSLFRLAIVAGGLWRYRQMPDDLPERGKVRCACDLAKRWLSGDSGGATVRGKLTFVISVLVILLVVAGIVFALRSHLAASRLEEKNLAAKRLTAWLARAQDLSSVYLQKRQMNFTLRQTQLREQARSVARQTQLLLQERLIIARKKLPPPPAIKPKSSPVKASPGIFGGLFSFGVDDEENETGNSPPQVAAVPTPRDWVRAALLASAASVATKLKLPRTTQVAVIDDQARLVFQTPALPTTLEQTTITANQDLIVTANGDNKHYRIRVSIATASRAALPEPQGISHFLSTKMSSPSSENEVLWGMLVDKDTRVVGTFPAGVSPVVPERLHEKGNWLSVNSESRPGWTRLEITPLNKTVTPQPWRIAAQLWLANPSNSDRLGTLAASNKDLLISFGVAILLAGGLVFWQRKSAVTQSPSAGESPRQPRPKSKAAPLFAEPAVERLVRKENQDTDPEARRFIMAEVDSAAADGSRIHLQEPREESRRPVNRKRPGHLGSLTRLQRRHRGSDSAPSSRVLSSAPSAILRTLAEKIRARRTSRPEPESSSAEGRQSRFPPESEVDMLRRIYDEERES